MKRHNSDKTWTHDLFIVITHLASVLNETWVHYVSLQKEFNEWQSDRLEMDLFREIHIPQTECGPSQKTEWPWEKHTPQSVGHQNVRLWNMVWLFFMDLGIS